MLGLALSLISRAVASVTNRKPLIAKFSQTEKTGPTFDATSVRWDQ